MMLRKETTLKKPPAPAMPAVKASIQPSVFDAMPDGAYIREAGLVSSPKRPGIPVPLPFSAPTLWRKVRELTFPAPVRLSERVTAWKVGEVRGWLAAQEAMAYAPVMTKRNPAKRAALVQA